ncbi:ABC transporter permease [Bacillus tropicus]|uniref:FtsX-like permease family protein n=1 Tax=Bacillus tropicus TaxID=2026188 RepID=UPI002406220B|nr:FtsX-like permease family protein [Bacillus tropicus]MDF9554669.1 ABC transporter permease [Bacillus tropicus]MDF9590705.1 ABC transporter permease [Bacillus tropicus]MDF9649635.1 ABC transporter permease [Bacillus tropicus]
MFFIFDSIQSVKKRLLPSLIIVISLIIAFSSAIEFISNLSGYRKMMTVANNLSTHKNFYELYATQDITLFSEEKAKSDYQQFIQGLSNTIPITNKTNYLFRNYSIILKKENGTIKALIVDKDINKYFHIRISQGRYFEESEFHKSVFDIRPVILGSNYIEKVSIGDVIQSGKMKLKVIGFLEKNSPFTYPRSGDISDNRITLLDDMAILSIGMEEIEFYSVDLLYNGLIIETNENINEFQKKVLKVTEGKGYSYYVTNPNKLLENEKQGIDNMSYPLLLSGTVLFFSFLSIVLTSMAALYMERKNISIKSALGASTFQICLPFIIEYMLLFILSICIGIMYFQWENSGVIEIQKELENSTISFFGTLQVSIESLIAISMLSIVMIFIIYIIIYFNVLKIKNTYMKEVL